LEKSLAAQLDVEKELNSTVFDTLENILTFGSTLVFRGTLVEKRRSNG
jgi:hypothetical protein